MAEKYLRDEDAAKILRKWRDHLLVEHQISTECEVMKELMWVIGEATDSHVVLGLPKPKEEVS